MQTTIKIHEVLNLSKEAFENKQIESYMRWCMHQSIDQNKDFQKIVANASINRYYNIELAKLENNFIYLIAGKEKFIDSETAHRLYNIIVVDMFKVYPSPLIHNARKMNVYAN